MKEFKGTPGKWKYTVRNVNEMMTTFHGVTIGDTYIEAATRNEREDALLIAAAPDLLEALQGYMSAVSEMNEAMKDGYNVQGAMSALIGWEDMARAAISKGLGEE
ncbi:TPA: hypothetical protein ACTYW0_004569 [Enterobacter asburiae]